MQPARPRDATMILMAFRHGLRASELVDLRWDQVSFSGAALHVRRRKAAPPHAPIGRDRLRSPAPPQAGAGASVAVRVRQ